LHGVNEELFTVNAEHQARLEELRRANDDMDNLLASTRLGVIFLDHDLYIRRFTPEIARVFHLVDQDVGRSIESLPITCCTTACWTISTRSFPHASRRNWNCATGKEASIWFASNPTNGINRVRTAPRRKRPAS
jgi:shikimate kinase